MRNREDRVLDLIDELNDHPEDEFLSGKMVKAWAETCLEYEEEERAAVLAFLAVNGVSPTIIGLVERGVHRKRSSIAMREIKEAAE